MPFDVANFEAEAVLKLIPSERLPLVAQEALEAGFDGPHVLRMAILEPTAGWAIDQALPPMLTELGCNSIPVQEAALRLAIRRAQHILETGEDPLPFISYFYRLQVAGDYPEELYELAYFDDYGYLHSGTREEKQKRMRQALEELISPELRKRRRAENKTKWEQQQARAKAEWPYVFNSPTGRALLQSRYKEKLVEIWPLLWIELVAWSLLGWGLSSWLTAIIGFIVSVPVLATLFIWGEYRRIKRERRDLLLRHGVPDNEI